MCPFCLATAAIIAGSATGTGGLTALVANKFRKKKAAAERSLPANKTEEELYGHEPDRSAAPESGIARRVD